MFRPKLFVTMLLFAAYLILEAACFFGKRVAPDYPDIRSSDVGSVQSVTKGRINYQFYPVDASFSGSMFLNYFGSLKGKADKQPKLTFALVGAAEKETLLNPDTSIGHFNKVMSSGESVELSAFQRRRHFLLRRFVPGPGRYYLVVGSVVTTTLKGERVFYFVTNFREKLKSFWPYALVFVRNFILACIVLFFAFCLYLKAKGVWRFAVAFLACGVVSFIVSATPFNVFNAATEGPKSKELVNKSVGKELDPGADVCRIPLEECSPYSACCLRIKGRALDGSNHSLVYTDLYKAPSYDDSSTENLVTFHKVKSDEQIFLFDSAHSFFNDISLRFWHEGRGGASVIDSVRLTEVKLPSGMLKVLLAVSEFVFPCFFVIWFSLFLTFCFVFVYFRRDLYSKLASFALALIALSVLLAPVYSFGHREPMMQTTNERFLIGLKPLSLYALVWHNEPKSDISPEELEAPMSGNLTVASYSDKVLGARSDIYPDNRDTFLRFFTHTFSNVRINVQRELVVLKDLRLVKLNGSYLMLRIFAWLWLAALIFGSLYQAVMFVIKGEKA